MVKLVPEACKMCLLTGKIWYAKGPKKLNAIRKHNCFLCSPFYVKGVSLGYVGRIIT